MNDSNIDFLNYLIENDTIKVKIKANDWQDAINKCFEKLLKNNVVNNAYISEIISSTIKLGPYYIICPNVAMPHANPKFGSFGNAFSLITLDEPVFFDDKPINILIGFSAKNDKNHLEIALPQICAVFENTNIVNQICKANNKKEIINIINKIDYKKYLR
ncbi:PTS sugar transporter subunit IIA [Spiroplasma endosymbiont of Aspidapion aeneum]|uniref:PTS sugar transporter subunit IIA n=1 Tax=Spiroplasma endosymbiont of Aspidapion aeneum TaxID=3066276 RepID=UPI00313DD0A9